MCLFQNQFHITNYVLEVVLVLICPVCLDIFQFVKPQVGTEFLEKFMYYKIYVLDPCPSWFTRSAGGGLIQWIMESENAFQKEVVIPHLQRTKTCLGKALMTLDYWND